MLKDYSFVDIGFRFVLAVIWFGEREFHVMTAIFSYLPQGGSNIRTEFCLLQGYIKINLFLNFSNLRKNYGIYLFWNDRLYICNEIYDFYCQEYVNHCFTEHSGYV